MESDFVTAVVLPETARCATLTVADGIALEAVLLTEVLRTQRATLRLWVPGDTALVVPRKLTHNPRFDDARRTLDAEGFPIHVRASGGDVVLQAPGVINIEIAFTLTRDAAQALGVEGAYGVICNPLVALLRAHGLDAGTGAVVGAFCDGRFNVNIVGRKLAGTAQRWRYGTQGEQALLVHAVVLDTTDATAMAQTINHFYALCALEQHCAPASHITLAQALAPLDAAARQAALAQTYARAPLRS